MSKPLTSQQEHFAQLVAQGKSHSDACTWFYNQMLDGIEDVIHLQVDNFKSRGLMC